MRQPVLLSAQREGMTSLYKENLVAPCLTHVILRNLSQIRLKALTEPDIHSIGCPQDFHRQQLWQQFAEADTPMHCSSCQLLPCTSTADQTHPWQPPHSWSWINAACSRENCAFLGCCQRNCDRAFLSWQPDLSQRNHCRVSYSPRRICSCAKSLCKRSCKGTICSPCSRGSNRDIELHWFAMKALFDFRREEGNSPPHHDGVLSQMPEEHTAAPRVQFPNTYINSNSCRRKLSPSCSSVHHLLCGSPRSAPCSSLRTAAPITANTYQHNGESPPWFNLAENITLLLAVLRQWVPFISSSVTFQGLKTWVFEWGRRGFVHSVSETLCCAFWCMPISWKFHGTIHPCSPPPPGCRLFTQPKVMLCQLCTELLCVCPMALAGGTAENNTLRRQMASLWCQQLGCTLPVLSTCFSFSPCSSFFKLLHQILFPVFSALSTRCCNKRGYLPALWSHSVWKPHKH